MASKQAIEVEVADRQSAMPIDEAALIRCVGAVVAGEGRKAAEISLAIVDDAAIHELNERYLAHDWPTDVLSFVYRDDLHCLEGEIIVSAETALREAPAAGWPAESELLLYVIHGALHLCGHDDQSETGAQRMRNHERTYLAQLGIGLPTSYE